MEQRDETDAGDESRQGAQQHDAQRHGTDRHVGNASRFDEPQIGRLHAFRDLGFLQALEHCLIHRLIGFHVADERVIRDLDAIEFERLLLLRSQGFLKLLFRHLRRLVKRAHAFRGFANAGVEFRGEFANLTLGLHEFRVLRAIALGQRGHFHLLVGKSLFGLNDGRRGGHARNLE